MKIHISGKITQPGGKALCGGASRITSGYSTTATEWNLINPEMRCQKCTVKWAIMLDKQSNKLKLAV